MKRFLSILLSLCLLLGYMTINVFAAAAPVGVTYQGHIQNIGWQAQVSDGQMAGTNGMSLRMEALKINLVNAPAGASIRYQAHVQNIGWQSWVKDGQEAGTNGLSYRVEAIRIVLDNMPGYSIQYQTYVQNIGWQNWVSDGQEAGTHGLSLRIEAMRIQIVKISENTSIGVSYQGHVQNVGWQNSAANGQIAGTEGLSYRVEALKINLVNAPAGASIKYQAHVQNIGWQNMVSDGQEAGTNGLSLRVEAIKITLVNLPGYSVQYQAHVQNVGWQNWVSDGQEAGTNGQSLRVEAIKIRIVKNPDVIKTVAALSDIYANTGTTADKLNLPSSVKVNYVDGSSASLPVVWDTSAYNASPSAPATYTLSGVITLASGVLNPDNLKASIKVNVSPAAKLLFTFDDGYIDDVNAAAPYLQSKGFKATAYINGISVDGGYTDYMSETQINTLYNTYGWDISSHTYSHYTLLGDTSVTPAIPPVALATVEADYLKNQNWLITKGWTRGAYHVAYPYGDYSTALITYLKSIGILTGRTVEQGAQTVPVSDFYKVQCIDVNDTGMTVDIIKGDIDSAISSGSTVILAIHKVRTSLTPATDMANYIISPADFQSIVDYAATYVTQNKLDVTTINDWYNKVKK